MELSKQQQLEFLFSIVTEASKWEKSSGDDRDSIRMEVEERIASLLRGGEIIKDGRIQSVLCPDPSTDYSPKDAWTHERVRVRFSDGKQHWAKRSHCTKVQRTDRPNLWRWEILPEYEKEYNFDQKEEESVCQQ